MTPQPDHFKFSIRSNSGPEQVLHSNRDFRADFLALSDFLSLTLRPLELDLARIGAAIYIADRLMQRPPLRPSYYPSRNLQLRFEVSDPDFWREIESHVRAPLQFLSDDQITLEFDYAASPPPRWVNLPLFKEDCDVLALYSGGLDSAAGLVKRVADSNQQVLTVNVEHQPHQRKRIGDQIRSLPVDLRLRVMPTFTRATLINAPPIKNQETTQRLRSFFFCALAGAVASRVGIDVIEVFENGIGAVNLPPMEGMFCGGLATRGAHPHFLRLMSQLVSKVGGRITVFKLPFKWWTKGEMVRYAIERGAEAVLAQTVSCVHYPLRQLGPAKQCGRCPGCLGHLQAMYAAGSSATATSFAHSPSDMANLIGPDAAHFRAIAAQVHDLRLLQAGKRFDSLRLHLESSGAITTSDTLEKWSSLHFRYADECETWLTDVQSKVKITEVNSDQSSDDIEVLMAMLQNIDPKIFGERVIKYRKAADKTQEQVADALGISRPTYIAIEKGGRVPNPEEIVKLAEILNRSVHELLRPELPVKIEPHLRVGIDTSSKDASEVTKGIRLLEEFAEDYLKLEKLLNTPLTTNYPPEVQLPTRGNLADFAEEMADRERARLQLGDQPISNLRTIFESEVGIRIFFGPLPSRVAGLYAFVSDLGCCMMINSKHPRERQRTSLAHEYGHVLIDRHKPGVDYFIHDGRKPANERFVEAFAIAFLIPTSGVRRHFREIYSTTGDFQVGDLVRISSIFDVSVQAMAYRLEGLGLISRGTWDMLISEKFKVHQAKNELELNVVETATQPLPERYVLMAVHAFVREIIGEGELARYLRCDRIGAREIVTESVKLLEVSGDGTTELFDLPFAQSLLGQK